MGESTTTRTRRLPVHVARFRVGRPLADVKSGGHGGVGRVVVERQPASTRKRSRPRGARASCSRWSASGDSNRVGSGRTTRYGFGKTFRRTAPAGDITHQTPMNPWPWTSPSFLSPGVLEY